MATPTSIADFTSSVVARLTTLTPTLTATAGEILTLSIAATAPPKKAAAQSVLDKGAPTPNTYSPTDPIRLFLIQAFIIVALSKLLSWPLAKLRQPKVISEVIGGIVLGPSIMGRIPGFTAAIFPPVSIPNLTLVANIGLVLFLFLVGLEADFSIFKKNAKSAIGVSLFGLIIPFGMGAAVSVGIYNKFVDTEQVDFGIFLLFIGTAMAITAFPVLARILTELKLLSNPVGLTTLAAGVANDVVGWILLALSVALANAGSGVTAVYILLCAVGLVLLLWFIVRPLFLLACRKTGSFENGPTASIMMLIFFIVFATAFITDIIGIHAIFGSFLAGLIVIPHHAGFGAIVTEKMEDLITILFIPIYFALSGLKTDLGLLNNGSIWGWVVCVCVVAFFSKFISCATIAKLTGFDYRESAAIGSLMACKGLVELIVLNIGLQAGILNNEVFAMFVVMALVTTFVTTPLTTAFYPERYWRNKMALAAEQGDLASRTTGAAGDPLGGEKGKDGDIGSGKEPAFGSNRQDGKGEECFRRRFVVVLERLESLPSMMTFVKLLQSSHDAAASRIPPITQASSSSSEDGNKSVGQVSTDAVNELSKEQEQNKQSTSNAQSATSPSSGFLSRISVDAFRLLALSDRTSALLRASESEVTKRADAILNIFSAFASLALIPHTTSMNIVPTEEYADTVTIHAAETNADLLVIPWVAGTSLDPEHDGPSGNPFESLFGQQSIERSPQYANFVRRVFMESSSDVALFLDRGATFAESSNDSNASTGFSNPLSGRNVQHIFLPFHGGPDDRAALDFVVQLVAYNNHVSATVIRFNKIAPEADFGKIESSETGGASEAAGSTSPLTPSHNQFTIGAGLGGQDTVYGGAAQGTQHRLASDTADNLALARYFPSAMLEETDSEESAPTSLLPTAIARIRFETVSTSTPLKTTMLKLASLAANSKDAVLVVAGRSRHSAPSHRLELEHYLKEKVVNGQGIQSLGIAASSEVRKTLGDVGSAVVVSGEAGSVLILQSVVKGQAYMKKKGKNV